MIKYEMIGLFLNYLSSVIDKSYHIHVGFVVTSNIGFIWHLNYLKNALNPNRL